MRDLQIRTARQLRGADRAAFMRIYEESFPLEERDEVGSLLSSIASGERRCELVFAGEELVGFAVLLGLSTNHIEFLEYLAVVAGRRSQGIGTRFLEHITSQLRREDGSIPGIVFEVDRPVDSVKETQRWSQRRIDFYTRNGAVVVDCAPAFEVPNLAGAGTVRCLLMWLSLDPHVSRLEGEPLRACVEAILTESYGLAREDQLVTKVVAGLDC